jgi:hypothetical protein
MRILIAVIITFVALAWLESNSVRFSPQQRTQEQIQAQTPQQRTQAQSLGPRQNPPQQTEQAQEQMRAEAQAQWEKKNCLMLLGQYVCQSGSGTIAPWSDFRKARPDLIK